MCAYAMSSAIARKEENRLEHVLEYFEQTAACCGGRTAVDDGERCYSWGELLDTAQRIASSFVERRDWRNQPVGIVMDKSIDAVAAFLGCMYAGAFYVLVNPEYPNVRIEKILDTLGADLLIVDAKYEDKIRECGYRGTLLDIEEAKRGEVRQEALAAVRRDATDKDLLYGIFTSGSTGTPKCVVANHRAVCDFIGQFVGLFGFTEQDIIGNQAPLDFDVSVKDLYTAFFTGATLVLIPKHMFSMPPSLLDFLCEKRVTSLTWAVSALCIVTTLRGFEYRIPTKVRRVLFSGEVMPYKHLAAWREALPDAVFVNLYGPTEIICNCTYYRVTGKEPEDMPLPIGGAFPNRRVFLLDENGNEVREAGKPGEICAAGTSLASGYYNNPEATAKGFTQNPLNPYYPERIYRTGDIGSYNEAGVLCFSGRKDFQVKRMGHRIELEEIQLTLEKADGVERVCAVYGEQEGKLVAFYVGAADKKELRRAAREQMPGFMIPDMIMQVEQMPLTKNGKIDRAALWSRYKEEKKKR